MRPIVHVCCALLLAAVLAGAVAAAAAPGVDWPGWRGPSRTGISAERGWTWRWPAGGPRVLWRAALGKGFSSFAVSGGRAYSLGNVDHVDTLFCLDAATGKVVWRHSYPCALQPLAYEGGPSATPLVEGGRVTTLSKAGHAFCLDAGTGVVIWSRKFEMPPAGPQDYRNCWGFAGSPLIVGDRLILAVGTAGLALDKRTGRDLWQSPPGRPGYSSPVPFRRDGRDCFALVSGHEAVAAEVATGEILWRIPWRTTWDQNAADAIVSGGRLFVSSGHGVGCALFDITGREPVHVWRNKALRNELSSSVLWQGHLYGFDDNRLACVAWETGETWWKAEGMGRGSLILVDGKLVILSDTGRLVIAEATPEAWKPLAEAPILTGRCWTAPVLSGGRLFARNAAGDAVCIDLRE